MQATVIVLGARGRFGLACARAFADAGWRVLAHTRPGAQVPEEDMCDPRIKWVHADLFDASALAKLAGEAAIVVHGLNPAYTNDAWRKEVLHMTGASIDLCRALGATLMVPGNIYNFGANMPRVLREDTPQSAKTVKGQIRIAMEMQIQRSGIRSIVIRAGDFFGSGKGTWFDQALVKDLAKGKFTYPGERDVATAWAYLPDLAKTFVALAQKRDQMGIFEIFHFAGHTITGQQWLDVLEPMVHQQGWTPVSGHLKFAGMPWALIRLGALFLPTWAALMEMRYLWTTPHALANDKLVALIGPEPHTKLSLAAQSALEDLGLIQPARVSGERQPKPARVTV
jgi:nucleoside-diphosphate-sugar epimerase